MQTKISNLRNKRYSYFCIPNIFLKIHFLLYNDDNSLMRYHPFVNYCIEFSCLMKSTQEHYAYCKYCKQDLSIQHGGRVTRVIQSLYYALLY